MISGNADGLGDGVLLDTAAVGNRWRGTGCGTNAAGTTVGISQSRRPWWSDCVGQHDRRYRGRRGNLLSGNNFEGIYIERGRRIDPMQGNYIGTNVTGTVAMANGQEGIDDHGLNNTIGGTAIGAGNSSRGTRPRESTRPPAAPRR